MKKTRDKRTKEQLQMALDNARNELGEWEDRLHEATEAVDEAHGEIDIKRADIRRLEKRIQSKARQVRRLAQEKQPGGSE